MTPAPSRRWLTGQDRLIGLLVLLVAGFLFVETFNFKTVDWDPLGLPFWPRVLLALLAVLGVWLVIRGSLDQGPFQPLEWRAFVVLGGALVYVLAIDVVGYLIATPLYLVAFHLALGGFSRRHLLEAVAIALLATGLIYWVFQDMLYVQFPEGVLFLEEL
jgi:putative tricarboxylic transport membrane protein